MIHSFDIHHAKIYGIHEAIMISNIEFWIEKNKANRRHFYEGRFWTYNSAKAFAELLPYMTVNQVRRSLDALVDAGVLVRGNFNQSAYDRTSWYAFGDKWISRKEEIHLADLPNGNGGDAEPIPDRKPDRKPDAKPERKPREGRQMPPPADVDPQIWQDWLQLRKAKKAAVTETVVRMARKEADKARMPLQNFLEIWCVRGSQGLKAEWLKDSERPGMQAQAPKSFAQQEREKGWLRWEEMTGRKHEEMEKVRAAESGYGGTVIDITPGFDLLEG